MMMGHVDDWSIKWMTPLAMIAGALLLAGRAARSHHPWANGLLVAAYYLSPVLLYLGSSFYAEGLLLSLAIAGVMTLQQDDFTSRWKSAILLGGCGLLKNEGYLIAIIAMALWGTLWVIAYLRRNKHVGSHLSQVTHVRISHLLFLPIICLLIGFSWQLWRMTQGIQSDSFSWGIPYFFQQIPIALPAALQKTASLLFSSPFAYGFLWVIAPLLPIVALVLRLMPPSACSWIYPFCLAVLITCALHLIFAFTVESLDFHLEAMSRLLVAPMALMVLSCIDFFDEIKQ